jgi:hypothetical protein
MYISVLIRRLRPGRTYEEFVKAWYPDKGFGLGGRGPIVARNLEDGSEILAIALIDLPDRASLDEALERVAEQESVRHERLVEVIESTTVRGIYEVTDEFDFSTDETVAARRPS